MVNVAVLVISSKIVSGLEPDQGRESIEKMIVDLPGTVVAYDVVPDDRKVICDRLVELCVSQNPDVILTFGGTGVRPTDWAPEATRDVIEKEVPGIGEAMRQESLKKVRTAMLSRGTAGIRGKTLIVNLPGSPKGARENLAVIQPVLDHTVEKIGRREA
ncbi:MogA/MoaB family molybdenum cofactor biosynthesis protein [Nitrospiraceae bacterium AH_259_D15_M11_P09]|nr:MogA/MoaB family molybdenum cofactor biosynthesis protein [Nitrospiraceae bacterium AH_259_D15_M11_P09]